MPQNVAESLLSNEGLDLNYYGVPGSAEGQDQSMGYYYVGPERWVLLPSPGLRILKIEVYFSQGKTDRWDVVAENAIL